MTTNEELICQICGGTLSEGSVVYCAKCNTPHHKDCWQFNKSCATYGCRSQQFTTESNEASLDGSDIAVMRFGKSGDVFVDGKIVKSGREDKEGKKGKRGKKSKKGRKEKKVSKGRKDYEKRVKAGLIHPEVVAEILFPYEHTNANRSASRKENRHSKSLVEKRDCFKKGLTRAEQRQRHKQRKQFPGTYSRLDMDLSFEKLTKWGSVFFSTIALFIYYKSLMSIIHPATWAIIFALCLISSFLLLIRLIVDYTYVLDNERRLLLYSRTIGGFTKNWKICSFDEIIKVGIECDTTFYKKRHFWQDDYYIYSYTAYLKLPNGCCIQVSKPSEYRVELNNFAKALAFHLKVKRRLAFEGGGFEPSFQGEVPYLLIEDESSQPPFQGGSDFWPALGYLYFEDLILLVPFVINAWLLSLYLGM